VLATIHPMVFHVFDAAPAAVVLPCVVLAACALAALGRLLRREVT